MFASVVMRKRRHEEEERRRKERERRRKNRPKSTKSKPTTGNLIDADKVRLWCFETMGQDAKVLLRTDNNDLWINDEKIQAIMDFNEVGVTLDFQVNSQKARILIKEDKKKGKDFLLTINGNPILPVGHELEL